MNFSAGRNSGSESLSMASCLCVSVAWVQWGLKRLSESRAQLAGGRKRSLACREMTQQVQGRE